jgi:CheY-like chemotaxis protein
MQVRSGHGGGATQADRKRNRSPSDVSIMVVDDDPEVREGLCEALTDEGYHVTAAANGADAVLGLDRVARPDLILMDLNMPVMDGYQFLEQRVRSHALSNIPVIIVSAALNKRINQPGVEVLWKPVDLDALLTLIRRQLKWQPPS